MMASRSGGCSVNRCRCQNSATLGARLSRANQCLTVENSAKISTSQPRAGMYNHVDPSALTRNWNRTLPARATRGFGDGFVVIVLPAYLSEIGFSSFKIGVVASAALLGTALTTLILGFLAARLD